MNPLLTKLRGIFPPIVTPFLKSGEIDYSAISHNLKLLEKTEISGLVVNGSNGEFAQMSEVERVELVGRSRELFDADRPIIAGSGCESTYQTIRMTNEMADVGAAFALVITPSFFKGAMKPENLVNHYRRVADASKIPVLLYNVPKFTGVELGKAEIVVLGNHGNILGLKQSDGGAIGDTAAILGGVDRNEFGILAGSIGFARKHVSMGAIGCVGALANILPGPCAKVLDETVSEASKIEMNDDLATVHDLVIQKHGVPGIKYGMDLVGFRGGWCREPLLPLYADAKREIRECMDDFQQKYPRTE